MAGHIRLRDKPFTLFFAVFSVLMGCYLVLRAIYNPLVFDEATTFFLYIKSDAFWPGKGYWSANNHFLNSTLSWVSYQIWGPHEWALRLPSLLSFGFFSYWFWGLLHLLKSRWAKIFTAIVVMGSHYWIEFFAYSRGYGWAFAFTAGSLLFLHNFWKSGLFKHFIYFWLCLSLLVFSSLSALPLAGLLALASAILLFKSNFKAGLAGTLMLAVPLTFGIWHAWQLKIREQLYYGGTHSFWDDSILSLQQVFFNSEGGLLQFPFILMGLALILALVTFVTQRPSPKDHFRLFPTLAFLIITLFYLLAPVFIELKYPFDRALLYWWFLGIIALVSLVDFLWTNKGKWTLVYVLPLLAFPATFPSGFSLQYSSADNWSREQIPHRFYAQIAQADVRSSVGGYYLREPQWQFLEVKSEKALNFYQSTHRESQALDYVLAEAGHLENYRHTYSKIDSNGTQNLFLLERQKKLQRRLHRRKAIEDRSQTREGLKLENYDWPPPMLTGFSLTGEIKLREFPFTAIVGIQGRNKEGETVFFKDLRFNRYLKQNENWQNFRLFVVLDDIPPEVENLEIFLWNKGEQEYSLRRTIKSTWHLIDIENGTLNRANKN